MSILSQFNSKVNVAKVVEDLGFKDCSVERLTPFGEFVYTQDLSFVGNVFNLFVDEGKPLPAGIVYRDITNEKQHYLKEGVTYSGYKENLIKQANDTHILWENLIGESRYEFENHKYTAGNGNKTTLKTVLNEQGYTGAHLNSFGHISIDIINKYSNMDWSSISHIAKPILVPFYHTPKHISYIKVLDLKNLNINKISSVTIYQNEFSGYCGKLGKVLPSFESLLIREGSTWNYTQDMWNRHPVEIDFNCSPELCLEIWKQAKKTTFKVTPLDIIKEKNESKSLFHNVYNLSEDQVLYLEEYFKLEGLYKHFKNIKETEYAVGNNIYYKRNSGYFFNHKGIEYQLTNFVLTVRDRMKKGNKTYYIVEARQGDKTTLFELDPLYFDNFNKLKRYIRETLLDNGLEMPKFLDPEGERRLVNFMFDYFVM